MKYIRYPLLFLAILFIPTSLAAILIEWHLYAAIAGYFLGYILIHGFMRSIGTEIYSIRMRTTYLKTSAIVSAILLAALLTTFGLQAPILYVGFPYVSVQLLLLHFFVRSESLYD